MTDIRSYILEKVLFQKLHHSTSIELRCIGYMTIIVFNGPWYMTKISQVQSPS